MGMEVTVLRALVVDDHALVRELLMQTLQQLDKEVVCSGARNADEALRLLEAAHYDLMLLDLLMPGTSGVSFLDTLHARFPELPAVVVSALDDTETIARAMRHGAAGFVPKACSSEELIKALRTVMTGVVCLPWQLHEGAGGGHSLAERYGITPGQMRVLGLLSQGKTNREIAKRLGLSEGTVRIHVSAILRALKVSNRAQAMLLVNRRKPER